jgi:type VI secretion system protein ImpA
MNGLPREVEPSGEKMSSASVLDFAKLLTPFANGNPAGVDLRANTKSLLYTMRIERKAARDAEKQKDNDEAAAALGKPAEAVESDAPKPADWNPVLQNATKALAEQTKDLEITSYLIEALLRKHGFTGLRDGFRLARELAEQFWDHLYPLPAEDGVGDRVLYLGQLNDKLTVPIRRLPITEKTGERGYSWADYKRAYDLDKVTDAKARDRQISQGGVTGEMVRKAAAASSAEFYTNLVQDLTECLQELARLDADLRQRCGDEQAPALSGLRDALKECLDAVKDVAKAKLTAAAPKTAEAPKPSAAATPNGEAAGEIRTREDAFQHLLLVADFFHRTEPHSIVAYTLEQVVRWGRMPLPELLTELIPEENPRKALFRHVGIRPPEPPKK